jgi:hypothetical protein
LVAVIAVPYSKVNRLFTNIRKTAIMEERTVPCLKGVMRDAGA